MSRIELVIFCALLPFNLNNFYVSAILPKNARGVDTYYNLTSTMLSCLANAEYSYVTPNLASCSNGNVNEMGISTIGNWIQAGFAKPPTNRPVGLYGYFKPCFCCPDPPESYVKPLFDAIATKMVNGLQYFVLTYLFIDVGHCGSFCTSADVSSVVGMLNAVISEAESLRTAYRIPVYSSLGIYTNKNDWLTLTGNSNEFSEYILWYADDELLLQPRTDCSDWQTSSFGGWSQPSFKQYVQDIDTCNNIFDLTVCCNCQG